ncbi:2084_t:CDS:1 [Scutellospora calospora]|uniref:2084_t:CDS:1 n=1 Tax=Scutellospora calospora TaxID=85575 RepID=A0ACA9MXW5_9GLOM|nr:2084_t:CDS:1 [Scutellospora calospora]
MSESPIISISPVSDLSNDTTTQNKKFLGIITLKSPNFNGFLAEHLHISPYLVAEISRTFISFVGLVIASFLCTFAIQWSDFRWKNSDHDKEALVDLGFDLIPETNYVFLADVAMLTLLVGSLIITMAIAESNIARIVIIRRVFWLLNFLLIFRMITISITTLPSPKECTPLEPGNFLHMFKTAFDLIVGSVKACTDNIFSGHGTFITIR